MKIAVVSYRLHSGGASVAAYRMVHALRRPELELDAQVRFFLLSSKGGQEPDTVFFTRRGRWRALQEAFRGAVGWPYTARQRQRDARRALQNLRRRLQEFQPDIINVRGLNQWCTPTIRWREITELSTIAPVCWTLSDLWPLTNKADYPEPYRFPEYSPEAAFQEVFESGYCDEMERQRFIQTRPRCVFAGPSKWITDVARSAFGDALPARHIAHGVDPDEFKPVSRASARSFWEIAEDQPVVAAVATFLHDDRKGMRFLYEALSRMDQPVTLLLIGHRADGVQVPAHVRVVRPGHIQDNRLLRLAYSAADVFVMPSMSEAFGLVMLEALSCGTPCVGFESGAVPEVIEPGLMGAWVPPGDVQALANAITDTIAMSRREGETCRAACREAVLAQYDARDEARRYMQLFSEMQTAGFWS